jgi:hypothetical protein
VTKVQQPRPIVSATVARVAHLSYSTLQDDMVKAFPEFDLAHQRLVEDWDNFGGEPPGNYLVLPDIYGAALEITLSLPVDAEGRDAILRRLFDFGEQMLETTSLVHDLGIDAYAERLYGHPAGRSEAKRLGAKRTRRWMARYGSRSFKPDANDEIIDLWGVRDALATQLPSTALAEIPGISHPQKFWAFDSLEEAQAEPAGTVLLSTFGTSRLYVVARASEVACSGDVLSQAVLDLARHFGDEDQGGSPGVRYRNIPFGERVWNMDHDGKRHTRLTHGCWLAEELKNQRPQIVGLLAGRIDELSI